MIGSLLQADFEEIIQARNWDELREVLSELDPPDIAELIIDLPPEDEGIIFRLMPRERAAKVFEYLPHDVQRGLVRSLNHEQLQAIVNEMTPDDRTRLIEELPAEATRRLLETLSPDELKTARELLGYPPGTAGRYMTPEYVALPPDITAREALDLIRRMGRGKETLNIIYIINERGKLLEDLRLGSLGLADPEMLTATAMGYFEGEIEKAAVVALFVPLIISSGGNSGSQGTSLIIRSLALKELQLKDWWRVFGRELRTGLALGVFLGAIGFLRISAWQGMSHVPHVGSFFQTHGSNDEQNVPAGIKIVTGDAELAQDVTIPTFTLHKGEQISKGTMVPAALTLPEDVKTMSRSTDVPTAYGRHWLLIGVTVFFALIGVVAWGSP